MGASRLYALAGRALALVAVGVLASACRADVSVDLDVEPDGSGTVSVGVGLDRAAVAEVGDLEEDLALDDLRQAGWEVSRREEGELTWVRAARRFADPEEAQDLLAQLGPAFQDLSLSFHREFLRTRTTLSGVADLTAGLASFADPDLAAAADLPEIQRRFGEAAARAVQLEITASLPGKVTTNPAALDGGPTWRVRPGERVELRADGELRRLGPLVAAALSLVGSVVLIVVLRRRLSRSGSTGGPAE